MEAILIEIMLILNILQGFRYTDILIIEFQWNYFAL